MTRHRFRLEVVLRIRRAQEESARQQLLLRNRELHDRLAVQSEDEHRYRGLAVSDAPVSAAAFLREQATAALVAASLDRAGADVTAGQADVHSAHLAWTASAMRVEALERLRARHLDEERVLEARSETATVDDLVTSRWVSPLTLASGTETGRPDLIHGGHP